MSFGIIYTIKELIRGKGELNGNIDGKVKSEV
jgi:hypothetical protein